MNGVSNAKILEYSQLQQLSSIQDNDIVSFNDGKLGVWKGVNDNGKIDTKDVRQAVFEAIEGRFKGKNEVVNAAREELLGSDGSVEKGKQSLNGQELKKILQNCEDINKKNTFILKPGQTKTVGDAKMFSKAPSAGAPVAGPKIDYLLPKPGETLNLKRDQLEANLDKWLKAGYTVTVTVKGKGSYRICEEKGKAEHSRQALFTPENGVEGNERVEFKFPEGNYATSRPKTSAAGQPGTINVEPRKIELRKEFPNVKIAQQKPEVAKENPAVKKPEIKDDEQEIKNDKQKLKNDKPEIKDDKQEIKDDKPEIKDDKQELEIAEEPPPEIVKKRRIVDKESLKVTRQTGGSCTCHLWSVRNAISSNALYEKHAECFDESPDTITYVDPVTGKLTKRNVDDIKQEITAKFNENGQGELFIKCCEKKNLNSFEHKFLLLLYLNEQEYRADFDEKFKNAKDAEMVAYSLPFYEGAESAKYFGLVRKADGQDGLNAYFQQDVLGVNVPYGNLSQESLTMLSDHLDKGELVTLNIRGQHFVTVIDVDPDNGTISIADSQRDDEKVFTQSMDEFNKYYFPEACHGRVAPLSMTTYVSNLKTESQA